MENVTLLNDGGTIQAHHLGLSTERSSAAAGAESASAGFDIADPDCTLASLELRAIEQALAHTEGNVSEAAKILGLSRSALRRRLEHMKAEE
jgi:DNA-binding NtrC family response regulator